jgi:hypothetical protein
MTYGTPSEDCRSYRTIAEPGGISALCNCGWASTTLSKPLALHWAWLEHSGQERQRRPA